MLGGAALESAGKLVAPILGKLGSSLGKGAGEALLPRAEGTGETTFQLSANSLKHVWNGHSSFGEHEYGYVTDEIPFGNEPLLLWFNILVDALIRWRAGICSSWK
ncbi:hypothetical protein [Desulfitobacterium sp.]|uniref:hypothetical protein n=1 Tax=Desulfitobacterium sp. TaxID=49981 RepID=UPI002B815B5A|nr:hypothetical protein [Desulfitobacterium sp.]HVJ48761.1 hypothetical protein [Desulfitobacterium sp.]